MGRAGLEPPANRQLSGLRGAHLGGAIRAHLTRTGVCCLREIRRGFRKLPDGIVFVPGDYDWW
jgi:hypothetical protein